VKIRIGSRGSALAPRHAEHVRQRLVALGHECHTQPTTPTRDRLQDRRLESVDGLGHHAHDLILAHDTEVIVGHERERPPALTRAAVEHDRAGLGDGDRGAGERAVETVARLCRERGARRIAVPPSAPDLGSGVEVVVDDPPLSPQALDQLDGVLTGSALAIAETGTIVLDGGERSGRRALTLVPDLHVCVVEEDRIVATVPDAVDRLGEAARDGRPITLVSGPSATSDIELDRVEGVHGPRRLEVLVVAPTPRA